MTMYRRFKVPLALLFLTLIGIVTPFEPSQAQTTDTFAKILSVVAAQDAQSLNLQLTTDRAVSYASATYLSGPERLVIELNDTLPATSLGQVPSHPMIESWSLKPSGLNRTQLQLLLRYRPADSELKVETTSNPVGIRISVPTATHLSQDLALTEGLRWVREDKLLAGRWVRLNRLIFNPKDSHVSVLLGLAQDNIKSRETISSMLKRTGALAGVNGGFFASAGGPLGLVFKDDKLLAPHVGRRPPRSGFGMTKDGQPLFGRPIGDGQKVKDLEGGDWSNLALAMGAGPRLIKDGRTHITSKEEELGPGGNDITRVAARSLVASLQNGQLMLATITGFRDNHSQGAKFEATADWLTSLGAQHAVNFDGGASVDMVIGDHIVSDGPASTTSEKPVATAILIKDDRERLYPNRGSWSLPTSRLKADGTSRLQAILSFQTAQGTPVIDGTPVTIFAHGVQVQPTQATTQNGQVTVDISSIRKPGQARIDAECGPITTTARLTLDGGPAIKILTRVLARKPIKTKDGQELLRSTVRIALVDTWGNPVAKNNVLTTIDGALEQSRLTDTGGLATIDVQGPLTGSELVVSHPTAGQVRLPIPALAAP